MRPWLLSVLALGLLGAAPVRDNTYITGEEILAPDVMANEDAIFTYLQDGVDTYAPNSITTAAIQDSAITSAKILDGTITTADLAFSLTAGQILPSGAVFFMVSGSCPAWTSDVSSTYVDRFVRISATAGVQAGADTHTHTAGSFAAPLHTHSITTDAANEANTVGGGTGASGVAAAHTHDGTTDSGGNGALSGISASGSTVPAYISMKACQVS